MPDIRPLSDQLQKRAAEDLFEIESRIPDDLEHIKNWLKKQPHLKVRSDDQWLVTFLRGCKYSLEKTKTKLELFYSFRTVMPEFYKKRYPFSTALTTISKLSSFSILPQNTSSVKPTLALVRWDACTTENCRLLDAFKYWLMCFEILLNEDDNTVVAGTEFIVDYTHFSLNYALQFTPQMAKNIIISLEKALPVRIKAIYAINAPPIFQTVYSVAKVFLSEKLNSRVFVYSSDNMEEFYKKIPQHVLPKEYGGDNVSVKVLSSEFNKKVESYGQWFLDDEQYCSNEALRPSNSKSPNDILGVEGSFRKLNVD